jgi:Kef-type K+ transport system membrane component KefB
MLFAGFETNPDVLKRHAKKNLAIGFVGYFFPFTAIFITTFFMLKYALNVSILLSLGLSTTSLALVYAVIRERQAWSTPTIQIMLGSAMIMDMLSMLTLTMLISEVNYELILYGVSLILVLFFAIKVSPRLIRRYSGHFSELEVRFILVLLLVMLFYAEKVNVSEAVLAYLVGVFLSDIVEEHDVLVEKLRGIVFGFFAPAFFFKAGLLINLTYITLDIIYLIAILGVLAYLSKYIGVYLVSYKLVNKRESSSMGLIFNFRLSFGIAAAVIGYETGILSIGLYTVIILIVLLTSVVSSVLLKVTPYELEEVEILA